MQLVIVESPTKAKTIGKFLGKEYKVESSYGHVRDLPKSKLGVDVEHDFAPQYVIPTKARKLVNQLKKEAAESENVILATDEDREGEAIAWHLLQALGLDENKTKRMVFHEITKSAIENALKNPRDLKLDLVHAQQARRILDRLVGYELSPFLWKKVARGLSAGRVQSVAVRLIMDRENEIRGFKPEEYWSIIAELSKNNQLTQFHLVKIDGKPVEKFDVKNKEQAEKIAEDLRSSDFQVASIESKEVSKNPPTPFTTSTMQQEAARKMGFSSKKTMVLAQHLYEKGHITYMRTDSVNLSQESVAAAKEWLEKELGKNYALESPRVFKSKSKLVQEAHEAVRPTHIPDAPDQIELEDVGEKKLYRLIWQRFMASQMPPARIASTSVDVAAGKYTLRATGQRISFDGYLKIYPTKLTEIELPEFTEKEELKLEKVIPEQHFTEPPARYSEAALIKALELHGIGRPSTYAPTISTIQLRNYVRKEGGRFFPTEIGELVNKVLIENFPQIVDIDFTAKMEEQLDNVAHGKEKWQELIGDFYHPFAKNLAAKYEEVQKQKPVEEKTDIVCDKCGKPMVIKLGRFGKFLACSGFPDCKNAKPLPKEAPKPTGIKCSKCGQGELVERHVNRGRARGKIFWGCNRYPDCDYATWENPTKTNRPAPSSS
ncbi:MAG: type I DNA topoisomerase [Patescibacteria group bacterium]